MSYPITPIVTIDFSNGATFGYSFIIGDPAYGILGQNVLADQASYVVDVSNQVNRIQTKGGYNLLQQTFNATEATFRIIDPNGDFNPQNTSSPYFGKLVPLRKIRFAGQYAGTDYYQFSGYITSYNYSYPKDQEIGYVDITAVDGFRLLNLVGISTVSGASAGQTTGQRINAILNEVSFPNTMRNIETGSSTVQADPGTVRTALAAIQNCEFSEQGAFYFDGEGQAVFKSRLTVEESISGDLTTFANDGTGIGYFNINPAFDDKLIINQASVTRVGGTTQFAQNADSVTKYFPHSINYDNVIVETDAEALNIASTYVATRAETQLRIDAITLDLTTPDYAAGILAALDIDYFSNVRIKNVGQDGTVIDKTLQVVGVAHDVTPNSWKTTFTTSEPIVEAFIIGDASHGIIGINVMTY